MTQQVRPPSTRAGGFTLIELLIVVAILGIIVITTITQLLGAREKAMVATCDAHMVFPLGQIVNDMDSVKSGALQTPLDPNAYALTQFVDSPSAVARNPRERNQVAYYPVNGATECPATTDPSFRSCVVAMIGGPAAVDEILLCQQPTPSAPTRTYRIVVN